MHSENPAYTNAAYGSAAGSPAISVAHRRDMSRAPGFPAAPAPLPIWFAALVASNCHASSDAGEHAIHWHCDSGRAVYTNTGSHSEWIESLGVRVHQGDTVSVTWIPGDTAYTVEVLQTLHHVA